MGQVSYGTITITDTTDKTVYIGYANDAQGTNLSNIPSPQRIFVGININAEDYSSASPPLPPANDPNWTWSEYVGGDGVSVLQTKDIYFLKRTTDSVPTAPGNTVNITSQSTDPAVWTTSVPTYIPNAVYYTSIQTDLDNNTYPHSTAVIDQALTDMNYNAYLAQSLAQSANENAQGALSIATGVAQYYFHIAQDYSASIPAGSYVAEQSEESFKANPTGGNLITRADGIYIRKGTTLLSSLTGTALTFYKPNTVNKGIELTSTTLTFYNPTTNNAQLIIGSNGSLQSGNYSRGSDTKFATSGTKIDLTAGDIITQYFRLSQGGESGGPGAGAYIHGAIEALSGRIGGYTDGGSTTSNYWDIGNFTDYNLQRSAKIIGHGSSFVQLGDSSTWRLATNRIHTGWYEPTQDSYLHFPEFTYDGSGTAANLRYWDYGMHVPTAHDDKFLYIRNASSGTSLQNLVYDLEDTFTTHYWNYKFWIDGEGNVYAPNLYKWQNDSWVPVDAGGAVDSASKLSSYGGTSNRPVYFPNSGTNQGKPVQITVTDNSSATAVTSTDTNLITARTLYYAGYVKSSGVTSVTIAATSPVVSSTSSAQTGSSASTTISLADNYGDTKNPYASKTKNYVLAAPSNANGAPSFRALVAADIPDLSSIYLTSETDPTVPSWAKASTKPTYSLSEITSADDIKAIEALTGTSGFLKKTNTNAWTLDTNTYLTSYTETDPIFVASAAYGIASSDITNWNSKTSNTGTVTSVQVQASSPLQSSVNTAQSTSLNTTISFIKQNPNSILAGPSSGSSTAAPTFRSLVATDIPDLAWSKITSGNDDLKAIEALTGTSGFLKKTAANTWSLDTTTYVPTSRTVNGHALSSNVTITVGDVGLNDAFTNVTATPGSGGQTTFTFTKAGGGTKELEVIVTASTATSATNLIDTNGNPISTTGVVTFSSGLPVDTGFTIGKSVPSDAKFTDTTYSFADSYNASTNKGATVATVTNAINALDGGTIGTPGAGKTVTAISQTNGNISVTFGNISITKSQISDFPTSMTPTAHNHSQIVTVGDQRSTATSPNSYSNALIFQGLKSTGTINNPSSDTYSYLVGLRGWSDSSGGNAHEIAFNNTGIFVRNGATTTWGNWAQIYTTANKPSKSDVGLGNVANTDTTNASNITSGTLAKERLATSGATAGSYGDSGAQTPGYGSTFKVPYVTVDAYGRVTSISEHTVKIPASDNTNTTYSLSGALSSHKFTSTLTAGGSGSGTTTSDFTLVAGDNITLTDNTSTRAITIDATDTTYESKAAASGGTAVSLVTTGEKYTWNNKQDKLTNPVTGTGTSGYLVKWNGTNSVTNGPQLGSGTTTYLRNDGTWATPVDTKVTQTATSDNKNYEILFSGTDDNTTRTEEARKTNTLTYNPSTKTLTTTNIVASYLKATNAKVTNILEANEVHTNKWTAANIANIGGSFYISPTMESDVTGITASVSSNVYTFGVTGGTFSTTAANVNWNVGSRVMATGTVNKGGVDYPLGTIIGILSAINATSFTIINIASSNKGTLDKIIAASGNYSTSKIQISMYQIGDGNTSSASFKPVGIYLTSYGTDIGNGNTKDATLDTFIDIYGGVSNIGANAGIGGADPNVRLGYLGHLNPYGYYASTDTSVVSGKTYYTYSNGTYTKVTNPSNPYANNYYEAIKPDGWGIYTDNGFFKGAVIASSGRIGDGAKAWSIGSDNDRAFIWSGISTITTTGTKAGMYVGTNGISNYKDTSTYVNIQNGKITAFGAEIKGAITATELKIGNSATNYANDITTISSKASGDAEYEVIVKVDIIDYTAPQARLIAVPTKLGASTTGTFAWYKNAIGTAHEGTVTTTTNFNDTLTVTDLNATYIAVLS